MIFTINVLIKLINTNICVTGGDIKVEIKMPREAEEGTTIELRCEWRLLGGTGLYSVKWYKDEHEFFRYVPDNDPKIQTFPQLGIHLDVSTLRI